MPSPIKKPLKLPTKTPAKTDKEIFFSRFNDVLLSHIRADSTLFDFIKKTAENPHTFTQKVTGGENSLPTQIFVAIEQHPSVLDSHKKEILDPRNFNQYPFIINAIQYYLTSIEQKCKLHYQSEKISVKDLVDAVRPQDPDPDLLSSYHAEIDQFCRHTFGIQDHRLEIKGRMEMPFLRRMDSLARLFSFQNSISVCTAVTIFNGQLIMAFNAEKNEDEDEIKKAVTCRLNLLRESVFELQSAFGTISEAFQDASYQMAQRLKKPDGFHVQGVEFTQAFHKIASELIFGVHNLSILSSVLLAADNPPIVLTPSVIQQQHPIYQNFPMSAFHAEQMIKLWVEAQQPKPQEVITIGLSRLCCGTCWDAMNDPKSPVKYVVSGTHQARYSGVTNFSIGTTEGSHPKRIIITHAKASPGDTPGKPRKKQPCGTPESQPLSAVLGQAPGFFCANTNHADRLERTPHVDPLNLGFASTPARDNHHPLLCELVSTHPHTRAKITPRTPRSQDLCLLLQETHPNTQPLRLKTADSPMDSRVQTPNCFNTPRSLFSHYKTPEPQPLNAQHPCTPPQLGGRLPSGENEPMERFESWDSLNF